jgi:hypothetical protein
MEYWLNGIKTYTQTVLEYPLDTDPIVESMHNGEHCLFYDPGVIKARIDYKPTVQDQCDFMNSQDIWQDKYRVATVVKLNIFVADIKKQGIVKPVMLYYNGEEKFSINTGENRMRAIERIPEITHLESFISTHRKHADKFSHLPYIENFEQFTEICRTPIGTDYLFTFTDKQAPYGIFWYEYNSERTRAITPGYEWCETVMRNYLEKYPNTVFTPNWFDKPVDWASLDKSNN